ncbi:MAG TPA: iron-sulfur cluster repair di-iron protein [Candidatus Acidoferrum sp.]|nr:iron-sulfur cluster repair di-iron protein [Candidatus Acidoferrum sp.]
MKPDVNQTVREIAIEHPSTVRVFESLGIDYCCGGKRSLQDACQRAGVPVERALDLLAGVKEDSTTDTANWGRASTQELVRHIVGQHHNYVRSETPRLRTMLEKVVSRHGQVHPEVASIRDLFEALTAELSVHMQKEENVLFPYFEQMESAVAQGTAPAPAAFGSVQMPISRMLADHDDAGELLAKIRALSSEYQAPDSACPTYRALYHGLEEFEHDLHRHVHLENNILFPRALHMEQGIVELAHEHH